MKRVFRVYVISCVFGILSLVSVSLLWKSPALLAGVLVLLGALMLRMRNSKGDFLLYSVCAISGALAETAAIHTGAWAYASPSIFGIPYWLPLLWGIAALFIKGTAIELDDILRNQPFQNHAGHRNSFSGGMRYSFKPGKKHFMHAR